MESIFKFIVILTLIFSSLVAKSAGNGVAIGAGILGGIGQAMSNQQDAEKHAQYDNYVKQITAQRDAGQISSVERAKLMKQRNGEIFGPPSNAATMEYWDYFEFIAYKRDNEGMSQQEATYLVQQKINEINARESQVNAAPQPAQKQTDYRCMSDCSKNHYGYDFCESKCSY